MTQPVCNARRHSAIIDLKPVVTTMGFLVNRSASASDKVRILHPVSFRSTLISPSASVVTDRSDVPRPLSFR